MEQTFKCACYTHELHVELPEEHDDNLIEIVMWSQGNEVGSSWGFRLRQCWHVLTKGHAYKDMVTLQPAEAQKLGKALQQMGDVAEFRQRSIKPKAEVTSSEQPSSPPQPESIRTRLKRFAERLRSWVLSLWAKLRR